MGDLEDKYKGKAEKSKFEKTREILYGYRYENSNFMEKGWYNIYSYWRLKKTEAADSIKSGMRSVAKAAGSIKESYKGSLLQQAVNTAGSKIKGAAVTVKEHTVKFAKNAKDLMMAGAQKVYEVGKSAINSELVQKAAKKTGGFFKASGAWIKDKAIKSASWFAGTKAAKAIASGAKATAEVATLAAGKVADAMAPAAKKVGSFIVDKAKKVAGGAKFAGGKLRSGLKFLAQKVSSAYDNVKSRYTDWSFERNRKYGVEQQQIENMVREKTRGPAYQERLKRFREDISKDKDIANRIKLRQDKERIKRNAGAMEKGNTGDVELADMSSDGSFKKDDPGAGMLQSLNKYDLGSALIEPERHKISLDDLRQKDKDEDLLKKNGIDPKNIPMTVPKENNIVGQGTKSVNEIKENIKEMNEKLEGKIEKTADLADTAGTFMFQLGSTKNKLSEDTATNLNTGSSAMWALGANLNALNGEKPDLKTSNEAIGSNLMLMEDVLDRHDIQLPVSNLSKAFGNLLNIADGKQREKNLINFTSNVLDEAGQILKIYGGDNTFSRLASTFNSQMTYTADQAKPGANNFEKSKVALNNIQAGAAMLKDIVKEAGGDYKLLDQAKLLKPVLNIIKGVEEFNKLTKKNEKINALTDADKSMNLTDRNVIRHLSMNANDLVKQNKDRQKGVIMNTIQNTALTTAGILSGDMMLTNAIGTALSKVSPTQLLMHQLKNKTDSELMMEDVFGSKENYEKYKNQYGLHKDDIENEILRMSNTATVKEYASRVRAETALHLHSRSKQAEKYGIENGATKIKEAAELGGKTAKDLYKEIGGREDYDKIVGRSKKDVHKQKVEEAKKRRLEERKQKELELQSGAKSRNGKSK